MNRPTCVWRLISLKGRNVTEKEIRNKQTYIFLTQQFKTLIQTEANVATVWLTTLLRFREVPGSKLELEIGYRD
jgi:hypothetical protein